MKTWDKRPVEVANLLNPAFCCLVMTSSIVGYSSNGKKGMELPLLFIVLPIILQKKTRDKLPRTSRTSLASWINDNQLLRLSLQERVIHLKPFVEESILFGLFHNWLFLNESGILETKINDNDINRLLRKFESETKECVQRSKLVGKWFAKSGSTETVMALWGVRP
jgi:hypothetical protein